MKLLFVKIFSSNQNQFVIERMKNNKSDSERIVVRILDLFNFRSLGYKKVRVIKLIFRFREIHFLKQYHFHKANKSVR